MVLSFLFNSIVAKKVSTEVFGEFSLILSIVGILILVSNLGLFSSIPVILAGISNRSLIGPYVGACVIIAVFTGISMCVLLLIANSIVGSFPENISVVLFVCLPVIFFAPCRELLLQLGKGLNNLLVLVCVRAGIPLLMLCSLFILPGGYELNLGNLVIIQYGSIFIFSVVIFILLKPKVRGSLFALKKITKKNRDYGSRAYAAHLFASTWPEVLVFAISYYASMTELAFYRVSLLLVSPLILISQNIATYFFKSFHSNEQLSHRFIILNVLIVCVQYLCFIYVIKSILLLFFGEQYREALPIIYIMALGASMAGLYQITDAFMNANSQGKSILISSLSMGSMAILSAIVLIPNFGGLGAAYAYLIANIVYLTTITIMYKAYILKSKVI